MATFGDSRPFAVFCEFIGVFEWAHGDCIARILLKGRGSVRYEIKHGFGSGS